MSWEGFKEQDCAKVSVFHDFYIVSYDSISSEVHVFALVLRSISVPRLQYVVDDELKFIRPVARSTSWDGARMKVRLPISLLLL